MDGYLKTVLKPVDDSRFMIARCLILLGGGSVLASGQRLDCVMESRPPFF
jgi:hypothetical protein